MAYEEMGPKNRPNLPQSGICYFDTSETEPALNRLISDVENAGIPEDRYEVHKSDQAFGISTAIAGIRYLIRPPFRHEKQSTKFDTKNKLCLFIWKKGNACPKYPVQPDKLMTQEELIALLLKECD